MSLVYSGNDVGFLKVAVRMYDNVRMKKEDCSNVDPDLQGIALTTVQANEIQVLLNSFHIYKCSDKQIESLDTLLYSFP